MKFAHLFALALFFIGFGAFAEDPVPLCTKGSLPKAYHGTYRSANFSGAYVLSSRRLEISPGYFDVSSCVVEGKRLMTMTDNNPSSTQNFLLKRDGADLIFTDIGTGEEIRFVRQDGGK